MPREIDASAVGSCMGSGGVLGRGCQRSDPTADQSAMRLERGWALLIPSQKALQQKTAFAM